MANIMTPVVRVESLRIENFKHVIGGGIVIHDPRRPSGRSADVVCIGGQNGSGKTAVVEAMLLLKLLLTGEQLPTRAADWVYAGMDNLHNTMRVQCGFRLENLNGKTFECVYEALLQLDRSRLSVLEESLGGRQIGPDLRLERTDWFHSKPACTDAFAPECLYCLINKRDSDALRRARSAKLAARRLGTSFLFCGDLAKILMETVLDEIITLAVGGLRSFGENDLCVIDGVQSGTMLPVRCHHLSGVRLFVMEMRPLSCWTSSNQFRDAGVKRSVEPGKS